MGPATRYVAFVSPDMLFTDIFGLPFLFCLSFFLQIFSNWFCARMKRLSIVADPAAALTEFLGMSSTDVQGPGRKKTLLQYYSKRHWNDRITIRYRIVRC